MYAQYIAAQAFNSGGLGIIHSISHAVSAFYDTHHGLNSAIALPRVWAFNMPVAYQRFADIADQMGVDTHGMTAVQAAEAALAAAIRLLRDVGIPEKFTGVPRTATPRTGSARDRRNSTRTPRRSPATPRTWTGSPGTSSATPAPRAMPRNAPSKRYVPSSIIASTVTWTTCSADRPRHP